MAGPRLLGPRLRADVVSPTTDGRNLRTSIFGLDLPPTAPVGVVLAGRGPRLVLALRGVVVRPRAGHELDARDVSTGRQHALALLDGRRVVGLRRRLGHARLRAGAARREARAGAELHARGTSYLTLYLYTIGNVVQLILRAWVCACIT